MVTNRAARRSCSWGTHVDQADCAQVSCRSHLAAWTSTALPASSDTSQCWLPPPYRAPAGLEPLWAVYERAVASPSARMLRTHLLHLYHWDLEVDPDQAAPRAAFIQ